MPPRHAASMLATIAGFAAAPAGAQSGTAGEIDRARQATETAIDDSAAVLADRPVAPESTGPTPAPAADPPRPGLTAGFSLDQALTAHGIDVNAASRLPEGTFLTKSIGVVLPATADTMVFVPDRPSEAGKPIPMILAPTAALERLRASLADGETGARFVVSGEVLVYRGTNHLLMTTFARAAKADQPPEPDRPETDTATPEPTPPEGIALDPSVAEIIAELESRRSARPGDDTPYPDRSAPTDERFRQLDRTDPAARAGAADEPGLFAEGAVISRRRVRIDRTPDGRWVVTFDNDTDTDAESRPAPPMVLIPCAMLERMEFIAETFGDATAIVVSGRVYAYDNENYLRPMFFVVERPDDVNPMQ